MIVTKTNPSILRGEHKLLSSHFKGISIFAHTGPMASSKTTEMIKRLNLIRSFAELNPPKEEMIITGIKNTIDNRILNEGGSIIESRISGFPAIITDTPLDWLQKEYSKEKVYVLGIADAQFFSFQQLKGLIEFTKQKENIYLILEGLDLNFRGEPFAHSDFKGTMDNTLSLIPAPNVFHQTSYCNLCGYNGATHSVRTYEKDGHLKPVPIFDKLIRVGSGSLENNGNDAILGIKNPKISYGALHGHEFRATQQKECYSTEWFAVYNHCRLYLENNGSKPLKEVENTFHKLMPPEIFNQIMSRLFEERVITAKGLEDRIKEVGLTGTFTEQDLEKAYGSQAKWIKQY